MIWPFARKPRIIDWRVDPEGWQAGDLALCIVPSFDGPEPADPKLGEVLRVTHITDEVNYKGYRCIWLHFEGRNPRQGWACQGFRKIRPKHEAAEASFTKWLRDKLRTPETVG